MWATNLSGSDFCTIKVSGSGFFCTESRVRIFQNRLSLGFKQRSRRLGKSRIYHSPPLVMECWVCVTSTNSQHHIWHISCLLWLTHHKILAKLSLMNINFLVTAELKTLVHTWLAWFLAKSGEKVHEAC